MFYKLYILAYFDQKNSKYQMLGNTFKLIFPGVIVNLTLVLGNLKNIENAFLLNRSKNQVPILFDTS